MEEDDLEPHLRDYLNGHRYLVVLDDVWDVNAWPSLMRAFPNENNGSRVILTTRIKAVAKSSDETTYVYELPFLKDEESWELFCSKAFPNYDDEVGNKKNRCPPHLESLAREMVSKCCGLPLAIVVLEKLPKLTILVMFGCGLTELVCTSAKGFSQLQILRIVVCDMNKFQVEEGGMPVLKGLSIQGNCDLSIPDRLRTFPAPQTRIDWFEWAFGSCLFHFANNGCLNKCA